MPRLRSVLAMLSLLKKRSTALNNSENVFKMVHQLLLHHYQPKNDLNCAGHNWK